MIANASGNAASSPMPPSTSHVSLPSQIGATEFIISVRASSSCANGNEDADAEVEAVEQHVHEHADAEDDRPDGNEVEVHRGSRQASASRARTAAAPGARRASARAASTCSGGPARARRTM